MNGNKELEAQADTAISDLRAAEEQLKVASKALWEATSVVSKSLYAVDEFEQARTLANDMKSAREIIRSAMVSIAALSLTAEKRLKDIGAVVTTPSVSIGR